MNGKKIFVKRSKQYQVDLWRTITCYTPYIWMLYEFMWILTKDRFKMVFLKSCLWREIKYFWRNLSNLLWICERVKVIQDKYNYNYVPPLTHVQFNNWQDEKTQIKSLEKLTSACKVRGQIFNFLKWAHFRYDGNNYNDG